MKIDIDLKGRPVAVVEPGEVYIKLHWHHREMLLELLEQVTPKGYNQKVLLSGIRAICHKDNVS